MSVGYATVDMAETGKQISSNREWRGQNREFSVTIRKLAELATDATNLLRDAELPHPSQLDLTKLAVLIANGDPPPWLSAALEDFAFTLEGDRDVSSQVLTRKAFKKKLENVRDTAKALRIALVDADLWDFMQASGLAEVSHGMRFQRQLEQLAANAERDVIAMTDTNGKLEPGRGRAFADETFSSEVYCAVMIAECWNVMRGSYPRPQTKGAREAASMLWHACEGAPKKPSSDSHAYWRPHLSEAICASGPKQLIDTKYHIKQWLSILDGWSGLATAANTTAKPVI